MSNNMKINKAVKSFTKSKFLLGFIAGIAIGALISPIKRNIVIGSYNYNKNNSPDAKKSHKYK